MNNVPISLEEELNKEVNKLASTKPSSYFEVKPVNQWINEVKNNPVPHRLFGDFWFEGELGILFSDTNQGKSILAVQIANSIATGKPIGGFALEAKAQKVLYFDFELSPKQFEGRYSEKAHGEELYSNHFQWPENFVRAEINQSADKPKDMALEDFIYQSLETAIHSSGARVVIIDNLTYIRNDLEKSKNASEFLKNLQLTIDRFGVSILVLTHTPKRDNSMPISKNDISGSKRVIDFCDSAFAIGESQKDPSIKYLKQVKVRQTEVSYGYNNVVEIQQEKPTNFLQFRFVGYSCEKDHLMELKENRKEKANEIIIKMYHEGYSLAGIAKEVGISDKTVKKRLIDMGEIKPSENSES